MKRESSYGILRKSKPYPNRICSSINIDVKKNKKRKPAGKNLVMDNKNLKDVITSFDKQPHSIDE